MKLSGLASPAIQPWEAERAEHSICFAHGAERNLGWHVDGRVFFCPLGKEFWRVGSRKGGMYDPLPYQHSGVI